MKNDALIRPFHLAYTVSNLDTTRQFYGSLLQCKEGRSTETWVDFDFFGHQLSFHIGSRVEDASTESKVDSKSVPMPHFGAVLGWDRFLEVAERFKESNVEFVLEPQLRYQGQPGEQMTMFVRDPSGNPLEFKAFKNEEEIYSA